MVIIRIQNVQEPMLIIKDLHLHLLILIHGLVNVFLMEVINKTCTNHVKKFRPSKVLLDKLRLGNTQMMGQQVKSAITCTNNGNKVTTFKNTIVQMSYHIRIYQYSLYSKNLQQLWIKYYIFYI
ncbi:unnamed protein product [Paramecium sonneborni]|uniref:Uncharacterized protein n=1 Tax=Paramecium sonneborni TaxID=65129 RepID=A0A8S1RPV3_9CILI|nr:unnamed protein product [Paramecium sonneborni]